MLSEGANDEKNNTDNENNAHNIKDNFLNSKRPRDEEQSEPSDNNKKYKEEEETAIKSNTTIITPEMSVPIVSKSVFIELQQSELSQEEIEKEYMKYKSMHIENRLVYYFKEHYDDEWFKEKYDPYTIFINKPEKDKEASNLYEKFMNNMLISNDFNGINLTMKTEDKLLINNKETSILELYTFNRGNIKENSNENEIESDSNKGVLELEKEPYYAYNLEENTIFLNEIPRTIKRVDIISAISNVGNYSYITLGLPSRGRNYSRFCWIIFDNQTQCDLALSSLKEIKITENFSVFPSIANTKLCKTIRLTPKLFLDREKEDLSYTKQLVTLFDKDKNLNNNQILNNISKYSNQRQLDLLIIYLRKVHGFCYYCVEDLGNERGLARYDFIHLRNPDDLGYREHLNEDEEEKNKDAIEYDIKLTEKIKFTINKLKDKIENNISKDIDEFDKLPPIVELREKFYSSQTKVIIDKEKYQCVICGKFFTGEEFVFKHITNKHIDLVKQYVNDKYSYNEMKENFIKDKKVNFYDDYNEMNTIDEYNQAVKNRQEGKRVNITRRNEYNEKRRQYKDFDSEENRIRKKLNIISYDDL